MRLAAVLAALVAAPAFAADPWVVYEPDPGAGNGKHVVLLSGDEEYRSEEALPMLGKILAKRHGFKCTVLFAVGPDGTINPNDNKSLPGAAALDTADLIVLSLRFRLYPDDVMKHFDAAHRRGVPFVGLRTSTHAFNFPRNRSGAYTPYTDFGKNVLGERWVSHWGRHMKEATLGVVEPANKDHPILRGVGQVFGDTDVYEAYPPGDATILMRGRVLQGMSPTDPPADYRKKRASDKQEQGINDPMMPIAWTRDSSLNSGVTNRVFCTTMGSATDLASEGLRRMVVNAVYWGLKMGVPAKADVTYVGPYEPTRYGNNLFKKGVKPADLAIKP